MASLLLWTTISRSTAFAFRPAPLISPRTCRLFSTTSYSSTNNGEQPQQQPQEQQLKWSTDRVRQTFIDYFVQEHGHTFVPSSACAPLNDPTLLFTNAGMNQFKPIFLGQVDPNSPLATLKRAVNSQKCIRAGGKHNDLEDVGRDTYHHTFFEMLGTWSFGDYFKKQAIDMAWDLLTNTKTFALDPSRIYATYFRGSDDDGTTLEPDYEARDYWLQYLPESRVIGCDAKDNFWEMGDTGPCGPCSEVHYDRIGGNREAAHLVNADDPNVIEIWNIVFIQYNRESPTDLRLLPDKHIDTGMGLERLVSILQQKSSNYDIDVFQPIFQTIATLASPHQQQHQQHQSSSSSSYTGKVGHDDVQNNFKDTAYRAIADHIRTLTFAIADGAVPNNEGRGYVLRRILRRATRYGTQVLNCPQGFFAQLVPVVVDTFGNAFPELRQQQDTIQQIIQEEEESFSSMLDRGCKYFDQLKQELQQDLDQTAPKVLSGQQAFFLYDTLGFPIDLTQQMAQEAGLTVDTDGFERCMLEQKQRSRQAQKSKGEGHGDGDGHTNQVDLELVAEQTAWLQRQANIGPTDDSFKYKWDVQFLPATVLAIYGGRDIGFYPPGTTTVPPNEMVGLILDKTSFYAEAGGQEADLGIIQIMDESGKNMIGQFQVTDVQVYAGYVVHKGRLRTMHDDDDNNNNNGKTLQVGSQVNCQVDYERRRLIAPNHSMTHVLNAALRQVLGPNVDQRGSLCNDEKLRFDFSHKKALTLQELKQVEAFCQESIRSAQAVESKIMPLAEAKELPGVRAVFGEVYPDPVRVISIGGDASIEFCGGTHLQNTAEAQAFCLVQEDAVAKGIRRISAVTQKAAIAAMETGQELMQKVIAVEGLPDNTELLDQQAVALRKDLEAAVISAATKIDLRARIETIQNRAAQAKKAALAQRVDQVLNKLKEQVETAVENGQSFLVATVDIGADGKASQRIRNAINVWAPQLPFLGLSSSSSSSSEESPGTSNGGSDGGGGGGTKLLAFATVPGADKDSDLRADEWIVRALESCGGRGGGKPDNAQGQASECNDLDKVLKDAQEFAASKTGASVVT